MSHVEALSQTRTRRDILKGATALGLSAVFIAGRKESAAATILPPHPIPLDMTVAVPDGYRALRAIPSIGQELSQVKSEGFSEITQMKEPTPPSLSKAFTPDVEQINKLDRNHVIVIDTACVEGAWGEATSMFTLVDRRTVLGNSSVQKLSLDQRSGKYMPLEQKGDVLMRMATSIAALPSDNMEIGKEIVVAGGYDFDNGTWPGQWPVVSISRNGAETFNPVTITNEKGEEKFSGAILQMKQIPQQTPESVIMLMMQLDPPHLTYGILNTKEGEYYTVSGSENAPLLDDLSMSPDNPRVLFGSGRLVEYFDNFGTPYTSAINDFKLNLDENKITESRTHHANIPYLNDLHVRRSSDGKPKIGYAPRLITDNHGNILERRVYTIDMEKDSQGYSSWDYGFMDKKLLEEMDMGNELNRQIAKHRHTTVISHIRMAAKGTETGRQVLR